MKSKLFSEILIPADQFIEDFNIILKLSPTALKEYEKLYNSRILLPQRLETTDVMTPLEVKENSEKLSISKDELRSLMDVTDFFVRNVNNAGDSVELALDDLITLKIIPDNSKDVLTAFFNNIWEKGLERAKIERRTQYEHGELCTLNNVEYDVDLRLVPVKTYNPIQTKIENYVPKGSELVPVAIINIEITNFTEKENCIFQVNFAELEDLIVRLQACQKELRFMETVAKSIDITKL